MNASMSDMNCTFSQANNNNNNIMCKKEREHSQTLMPGRSGQSKGRIEPIVKQTDTMQCASSLSCFPSRRGGPVIHPSSTEEKSQTHTKGHIPKSLFFPQFRKSRDMFFCHFEGSNRRRRWKRDERRGEI